ncbi:hypothetical protein FQA39_LY13139 [Lamprigera yunnana]|nr:hypothetical protein FQA39_LY13139 [Lamprigera yunnana]
MRSIMELLIECVRENKVLYDAEDKNYMRTKYKNEIWDKIAVDLNYSNEDHIVRRRQREEERKRKTDEKPDSLYQFFLSMSHDTKEMPHISQLRIKRKLFETVQVEEDVIAVSRKSAVLQQSNTIHSLFPQSSVELNSRATSSSSSYEQELQPMSPYTAQQSFDVHCLTPHSESRSSYLGNMSLSSCYKNFDPTLT